jgi:hypothetical protein
MGAARPVLKLKREYKVSSEDSGDIYKGTYIKGLGLLKLRYVFY